MITLRDVPKAPAATGPTDGSDRLRHQALQSAAAVTEEPEAERLIPTVPIKKSVQPDYIVCLEDDKRFKSLKRHLRAAYNLTSEEYRARWGLEADYPMVAPNYAAARSEIAEELGLGRKLGAHRA
ncbi:MucR family transcriptional regulator [Roseibium aggregatum]|uniref:MucR family transcriptional regulator n=1 Tax=Roseibium aggregatum TaxID=187304 RepID=UPI0009D6A4A5